MSVLKRPTRLPLPPRACPIVRMHVAHFLPSLLHLVSLITMLQERRLAFTPTFLAENNAVDAVAADGVTTDGRRMIRRAADQVGSIADTAGLGLRQGHAPGRSPAVQRDRGRRQARDCDLPASAGGQSCRLRDDIRTLWLLAGDTSEFELARLPPLRTLPARRSISSARPSTRAADDRSYERSS